MMIPPERFEGWKIWTVGDDIAWMRVGDGRPAVGGQPGGRLLRRRARHELRRPTRTRWSTHRARTRSSPTSRVTPDGDVWWEGMDGEAAGRAHRLAGPALERRARRRRRRTRTAASPRRCSNNPALSQARRRSRGRADQRDHLRRPPRHDRAAGAAGVQLDARRLPRRDAWAPRRPPPPTGKVGVVRRDPMAMLPFCGYNMGDYFAALAAHAGRASPHPPKIFQVNWFRKGKDGKFLWPGFGENMRVLKWIVDRAHGRVGGAGDAVRLGAATRATRPLGPRHRARAASTRRPTSTSTSGRPSSSRRREFFEQLGPTMPTRAQAPARAADGEHRSQQRKIGRQLSRSPTLPSTRSGAHRAERPADGWGPDGFAGGAGRARALPVYWVHSMPGASTMMCFFSVLLAQCMPTEQPK